MNKSILLSIKPQWVAKIMNGEKTIEIRKNKALYKATIKLIEEQGYATFFMYCTKGEQLQVQCTEINTFGQLVNPHWNTSKNEGGFCGFNGKVVAKFTVRKVEVILEFIYPNYYGEDICDEDDFYYLVSQPLSERKYNGLKKTTCLSDYELDEYLVGKDGYAYHIEDLVIFDKPKELSEFKRASCKGCFAENTNYCDEKYCRITKAPQNFVFVESEE